MTDAGNPIAEAIESLGPPSQPGVLNVRNLPLFVDGVQIRVARDYFGSYKMFLPSREGDLVLEETQMSAGFSMAPASTNQSPGVVFSSTRGDATDLFAHLSIEICRRLNESDLGVTDVIAERISHWKELLASLEERQPSHQEQLGLIGELLALRQIVLEAGREAAATWFGPMGSRHDFESERWALEVKTSLSLNKKTITVSNRTQLESNKPGQLRLLHLQLELALGGLTIASLVAELREICSIELLTSRLNKYFPKGLESLPSWASSLQITVADGNLYLCDAEFPRLRLSDADPVTHRVSNIKYDLNLDGLEATSVSDPANPVALSGLGILDW